MKDERTYRIIGCAMEVQSADPPAIARPVRLAGAWQAGGHERAGYADYAERIKGVYGIMEIGFVDQ